ncbi:MAG: PilW family protein [Haliea sp.]|nr:PilW family protein [Haliea sp.]
MEISVLVRAECPEAGFDINRTFELGDVSYAPAERDFRRQVFTTTTQLRN